MLLTFNPKNSAASALTRVLHSLDCSVHHLELTGHQPVLSNDEYRAYAVDMVEFLIGRLSIDFLLPLFEESFFLSAARERLACPSIMARAETYRDLHFKRAAVDFNDRHGLPQIPTLVPGPQTRREDVEQFFASRRPLYLKEDDSRGGFGTRLFGSARSLFRAMTAEGPSKFVIQACWPGDLWVVQGIFRKGRLLDYESLRLLSPFRDEGTVRLPPFERSESHPMAQPLLEKVGRLTEYEGMLEFEALSGEDDFRILEYNPRFSGVFLHSVETGSSLALNTARLCLGLPPVPRSFPAGRITRSEGIFHRCVRRHMGAGRYASLLDPRWLARWMLLELASAHSRRSSPYRSFSSEPESFTSIDRCRAPQELRRSSTSREACSAP